jgi:hypothetical protein
VQELANVLHGVDTAAHCQRHKNLVGCAGDNVENDVAVFVRRGDIQKAKFIRSLSVINARHFHGIAGILQIEKFDSLDHTAGLHVETWNDSFGKHGDSNLAEAR